MALTTRSRSSPSTRSGIFLALARVFQILVICLTVGFFIVSVPINYEHRSTVCQSEPCPPNQLNSASVSALGGMGMSVDAFVRLTVALDILVAAAYTISAVILFVRKPNDGFTIFVTVMLVTFGVGTFTGATSGIGLLQPQLLFLPITIEMIGNCAILAFFYIFPSGRFVPRWTFVLLLGWIIFQLPRYYFPSSSLNLAKSSPALYNIAFMVGILSGLVTQVYRYLRISDSIERQQTKWVVYGLLIGVGGYLVVRYSSLILRDPIGRDLPFSLALNAISVLFMLLVPISISIAILRYRLWDINPIINRTLVYGALSVSTIALYILAVGFFSSLFQSAQANYMVAFIATGAIAILFQPLRERLQRGVNRLMYGERDDPATVLARLSQRLDSTLAPESVLPTIVETVAQTLRLPYAAIALSRADEAPEIIAQTGQPVSELFRLPLSYQTERVGELLLAPRSPGESFSSADLRLLNIIAQQAGIAAHTVRLTGELRRLNADLQQSRERLVTAQEEERRRLRRDLHDGVGPTLASLSQRLETASDWVMRDPQKSMELLKALQGQVKGTVAEIRRLVYALRPPVLDEFGPISAIREHVAPYTGPNGLQVSIEASESLPPLPAAVEVAAYRIVLEAFTNVVQHAQARACQISIRLDDQALLLEISDDGKGLPPDKRQGVGLSSMRERAAELGGEFSLEKNPAGGTRIRARLPIPKE